MSSKKEWSSGYDNIIWKIIQEIVSKLADGGEKKIYQNAVYKDRYTDDSKQRRPKAKDIKKKLSDSKDPTVRNLAQAIRRINTEDVKKGDKRRTNTQIASDIYMDEKTLINEFVHGDFARSIFSNIFIEVYDGRNYVEEDRERKRQKRKQDEEDKQAQEDAVFTDDDEGDQLSERDKKQMKREADIRLGEKVKSVDAKKLTKAKVYVTKPARDKKTKELGLDNKEKTGTQRVEEALQFIKESKVISLGDLSQYLTVLLNFATQSGIRGQLLRNVQETLLNNYNSRLGQTEQRQAEYERQEDLKLAEKERIKKEERQKKERVLKQSKIAYTQEIYGLGPEQKKQKELVLERDRAFKKIMEEQKRQMKQKEQERIRGEQGQLLAAEEAFKKLLEDQKRQRDDLLEALNSLPPIEGKSTIPYTSPTPTPTTTRIELKEEVPLSSITQQNYITDQNNLDVSVVPSILESKEGKYQSSDSEDEVGVKKYDIDGIVLSAAAWERLADALSGMTRRGALSNYSRNQWIRGASNVIANTDNIDTEEQVFQAVSTYVANFYNPRQSAEFRLRTAGLRETKTTSGEILGAIQSVDTKITNADIKRAVAEDEAEKSRQRLALKAEEERQQIALEQKVQLDSLGQIVNNLSRQFPELERKTRFISNSLKEKKRTKRNSKILNDSQINTIINSIPNRYRNVFSDSIINLLRGETNLNIMLSGLAGLTTLVLSNSAVASQSLMIATNYLFDTFDINLNDYLYDPGIDQKMEQLNDINNLSTADEEFINNSAKELTENVIDSLDMKITQEQERGIRIGAMEYIRNFLSAISGQIFTPGDMITDDIKSEIVQPIGFFDYVRNVGGLPQAIMNNIPDISLNDLKQAVPTLTEIKSAIPYMRGKQPDLIVTLGPDGKPMPDRPPMGDGKQPPMGDNNDGFVTRMRDRLRNIDRRNFPSAGEIKEGVVGGIGGAIVPAAVRGGAMGAVGGVATGGLGGGAMGAISGPMIRRFYEQQGADLSDPEVRRQLAIIQSLPPTLAGAIIGGFGIGEGILSGAGVTERKITVDQSVLDETKATEQQDTKQTKKWITKAIFPTPDILDETRQEKFIDDLEFAAFNYIEPTSQGATGTVKTNPLKRSQFLSDQIRYMDAGISTPSMLYNVEFPTNTPQKQMDTYKLGQDMLPEMTFMEQDNGDTFTPIGKHYVNNEDQAIEMFSPFSGYSDVRNYWAINQRSKLYNLYA